MALSCGGSFGDFFCSQAIKKDEQTTLNITILFSDMNRLTCMELRPTATQHNVPHTLEMCVKLCINI